MKYIGHIPTNDYIGPVLYCGRAGDFDGENPLNRKSCIGQCLRFRDRWQARFAKWRAGNRKADDFYVNNVKANNNTANGISIMFKPTEKLTNK